MQHNVTIRCETCGSHDVRRDAWAYWDYEIQQYRLAEIFDLDQGFCVNCDTRQPLVEAVE